MQEKICRNCGGSFRVGKTKLAAAGYCSCACRKQRQSWINCAQCLRDCGLTAKQAARLLHKTRTHVTSFTKRKSSTLLKSIPIKKKAREKKNAEKRLYRDQLFDRTGYRTTEEERRKEKENRPKDKKRQSPESRKNYTARYLSKPENRLRLGLARRLYKALKGRKISRQVEGLTGCSLENLKDWIESQFKRGMSWQNYGVRGWHIDHIQPCASFDHSNPEHVRRCWHFTNLRPMWAKENIAKGARITEPQMHLAV